MKSRSRCVSFFALAAVLLMGVGCSTLGLPDDPLGVSRLGDPLAFLDGDASCKTCSVPKAGDCESCGVPGSAPVADAEPATVPAVASKPSDGCAAGCAPPAPAIAPNVATVPVNYAPVPATYGPARPADARPGEVYCYVQVPPESRVVDERYCVSPASCTKQWVPAVKRAVTRNVCVRPASCRNVPVPAEYENRTRQVLVRPASMKWVKVACNPTKIGAGERVGACWTLQEQPAEYRTVNERVCVRPATYQRQAIPAEYRTETREVVVRRGYYRQVPVPAQYGTRQRTVTVRPARWEWRRQSECEIPGMTPAPTAPQPNAAPGPGMPIETAPAASANPVEPGAAADMPPTGTLSPLPPNHNPYYGAPTVPAPLYTDPGSNVLPPPSVGSPPSALPEMPAAPAEPLPVTEPAAQPEAPMPAPTPPGGEGTDAGAGDLPPIETYDDDK